MINKLSSLSLVSERLLIRPVEQADLEAVYSIHVDEQVNQFLPYDTWTQWSDALAWLERVETRRTIAEAEQFVIRKRCGQQLVGTCIVFDFDASDQSFELGYVLHRDHWGNGYMLEACQALVDELLSMSELEAVRAVVKTENKSSLNLLSKLGFELIYSDSDESNTSYLRLS